MLPRRSCAEVSRCSVTPGTRVAVTGSSTSVGGDELGGGLLAAAVDVRDDRGRVAGDDRVGGHVLRDDRARPRRRRGGRSRPRAHRHVRAERRVPPHDDGRRVAVRAPRPARRRRPPRASRRPRRPHARARARSDRRRWPKRALSSHALWMADPGLAHSRLVACTRRIAPASHRSHAHRARRTRCSTHEHPRSHAIQESAIRRPTMTGPAIHPTSVIDPAATLGDGVTVGPFTLVDAGVVGRRGHVRRVALRARRGGRRLLRRSGGARAGAGRRSARAR